MGDDRILLWHGRPVEELTREELIDALKESCTMYHAHLERSIMSNRLLHELHMAARRTK